MNHNNLPPQLQHLNLNNPTSLSHSRRFTFDGVDPTHITPVPGQAIIQTDPPRAKVDSIHIPESAQAQTPQSDVVMSGVVFKIGYGSFWGKVGNDRKNYVKYAGVGEGEIRAGDRVLFRGLMSELNEAWVMVDVRRIDAVVEADCKASKDERQQYQDALHSTIAAIGETIRTRQGIKSTAPAPAQSPNTGGTDRD